MTKLPRDVSGAELIHRLRRLGYHVLRQKGSHVMLFTELNGGHTCIVAQHRSLKPGTLEDTLKDIGRHHSMTLTELLELLEL
jgi:predicted RNA binding protein YcfA (HicA-like mRNA interferase family)